MIIIPGHLEKRNKGWTIVIETGRDPATGKRKRIYQVFQGTKKDAEKELNRMLHELETGMYVESSKLTFGEYLRKWLTDYAKISVAPKTYLRYEEIVTKSIIPGLGQLEIEKFKPLHLQGYYAKMLTNGKQDGSGGLSPTTVLQHHRIIHKSLEMAVRWQIIYRNVADAVEPPKKVKAEITPLYEDQVYRMLEAAEVTPYFPQIVLAILTGMRRGEIYGLRWKDINFDAKNISINQSSQYLPGQGIKFKDPKNTRSRRTIDVSPYVLSIFKKVKIRQSAERLACGAKYSNEKDLIFTQPDGNPQHPDSISSWFPEFMEKNGLPKIRLHDLRHTHASLLLQQGESLKLISERLGHAGIGITSDTYTHLMPGMQQKAAQLLEDRILSGGNGRRLGDF